MRCYKFCLCLKGWCFHGGGCLFCDQVVIVIFGGCIYSRSLCCKMEFTNGATWGLAHGGGMIEVIGCLMFRVGKEHHFWFVWKRLVYKGQLIMCFN